MNRERALLLTALGDFLHRRRTVLEEEEYDWSELYQRAAQQRLSSILFFQIGEQIPEPFYTNLHTEYLASILRYRHRRELSGQMEEVLRRSGVDYFHIKGDLIGELYTNPMLRTVSDVDLMVPAQQFALLHKRMKEAGFTRVEKGRSVWVYTRERVYFEVHNTLIDSTHREDDAIADYLSHCWEHVHEGALDWNNHMIYLLLHLRKHFRSSGVGFRQFLDLAFVAQEIALDWDYIRAEMDVLGLWRFTVTVMNLCDLWFGTDRAPEKLALEPEFVEQSTDRIYQNGVFGNANEDNKENDLLNTARSEGWLGLVKRILLLPFPGYLELQCKEQYRFLRNRPWLLPVAWVWHFILFFTQGRVRKRIQSLLRIQNSIKSRNDTYEQWGL